MANDFEKTLDTCDDLGVNGNSTWQLVDTLNQFSNDLDKLKGGAWEAYKKGLNELGESIATLKTQSDDLSELILAASNAISKCLDRYTSLGISENNSISQMEEKINSEIVECNKKISYCRSHLTICDTDEKGVRTYYVDKTVQKQLDAALAERGNWVVKRKMLEQLQADLQSIRTEYEGYFNSIKSSLKANSDVFQKYSNSKNKK